MPVVNLVSDFGGVGDGQRQTVNVTVSNGSPTLTVGTAIFNPATIVGKRVSVWNGSSFTTGVVLASPTPTSTVVTLNGNFNFSVTASSSDVLWGTDNSAAFTGASGSWRAYARTQTDPGDPPILEIPDGYYAASFSAQVGGGINVAVLNSLTMRSVSGNAAACTVATFNNGEIRFGGDPAISPTKGLYNSGGNSVRVQSASAGASTITLSNPSGTDDGGATYGSRVVVGRACLLTCFDVQGLNEQDYGYPPNSYFYEWNTIAGYDSGTGVVTLQTPLTQEYKSTYPRWGPLDTSFAVGNFGGSDQGGPFTMWVCPSSYDNTVTLENFTIDSPHNQTSAHIRNLVLNGVVNTGFGLYPTQNDTFTATDTTYVSNLEVDKMVGTVTWNNCTLTKIQQQSASPNRMIINGGTIKILETTKYTEANNVSFIDSAQITFGVTVHGRTNRVVLNGCTGIATIARGGASTIDLFGSTGPGSQGAASDLYSFVGGVMRFAKAINDGAGGIPGNVGQQNLTRCLVPGTYVLFDDKYMDRVTDVYEDGTYCYIQFASTTDWPFTPVSRLKVHPCPDFTMINCTGTAVELSDWNRAPPRIPLYSYLNRDYVADASGTTAKATPVLLGRMSSLTYTVSTAYTGSLTFKISQFNNWTLRKTDYSTYSMRNDINMNLTGVRVVRDATTSTGAQSGDTLPDLTSTGALWSNSGSVAVLPVFSANVTNGETPTINVVMVFDQGIPSPTPTAVVPLRLRLRAA